MRIAYCIMCHKFTPTLQELVRLVGESNDVIIHVDAKADIADFASLRDKANFLEDRVDVRWGRWSQIEAVLRLLDASRRFECDYVALISGDTLPLKSDDRIKKELWKNRGREYLYERPLTQEHVMRIKMCHPRASTRTSKWAVVRRRLGLMCRNKWFDTLPQLHFGSNWFIITPDLRDWFFDYLGQHPEYSEAFRRSHCGDELFFMTLACNSPFAESLTKEQFFYFDWTTGPDYPRTLDESDFPRLAKSDCLFARKFRDDLGGAYTAYSA